MHIKKTVGMILITTVMAVPLTFSLAAGKGGIEGITPKSEITKAAKAAVNHISAADLKAKIDKKENFFLIDVRSMAEYQAGHIEGAMWIPRGWVEFKIAKIVKDAGADIVIYCKAGSRGSLATKAISDMGYKNVQDLDDGYKSWVKAKYPLFNIHGKIQVLDMKAKENSPHGSGLIRNVNP